MEINNLEQASECLKDVYNYFLELSNRSTDRQLEDILDNLESLIEYCQQHEYDELEK